MNSRSVGMPRPHNVSPWTPPYGEQLPSIAVNYVFGPSYISQSLKYYQESGGDDLSV